MASLKPGEVEVEVEGSGVTETCEVGTEVLDAVIVDSVAASEVVTGSVEVRQLQ